MTEDLIAKGKALCESGQHDPPRPQVAVNVAPQSTAELLDATEAFARPFLAFPNAHYLTVLVLWIAHTWVVPAFYITPRLVLDSPEPGSGKTRVLEILALLCRGAKLTLSTTTAALYRRIAAAGDDPPTILQDEADAVFGRNTNPQSEDLRALYNSGYKRGATVDRCEGDAKRMEVREFPVFAPVALAGLAGKMPSTITDRAITLHMRRRAPDEQIADFRERDAAATATPLRAQLDTWSTAALEPLAQARPAMPDGVRDRNAEVWEALLAIADLAGGSWPDRAREACKHFVLGRDPDELSFGARLLRDVREIFGDREQLFSVDIISGLLKQDESEWLDLWGKPLDQARLAKELKRYGVKPEVLRIHDARARGYRVSGETGLAQAWERYLAPREAGIERDGRASRDIAGHDDHAPCHGRDTRDRGVTDEIASDLCDSETVTAGTAVTPPNGTPRNGAAVHRPDDERVCCRCGERLLAPASIARGLCERCHLTANQVAP